MSADLPEPSFDEDDGGQGRRERSLAGQAAYEDSAVRKVCASIRRNDIYRACARAAYERTHARAVSFPLFDELADFPIRFRVGRLARVHLVTMPDLFDRFTATPIGAAFIAVAQDLGPAEGPVGLVFRWDGVAAGAGRRHTIRQGMFMAAHSYPLSRADDGVTRVTRSVRVGRVVAPVTIETLESLLGPFAGWAGGVANCRQFGPE